MVYTGLLYQDLIKSGEVCPGQKLPSVFPLVLNNGRSRWTAARDVSELIRRFGPLPSWVHERLGQATPEQLETWGLDLLDAAGLDDVFKAHCSCESRVSDSRILP